MKIDFSSQDFLFISKPEKYYIEGHPVQCDSDYSNWKNNKIIESGWDFLMD